ncbi:MAG: hypothetical protein IT577_22165 [Verrucomicrobiae bacterium]|nr:hypothetical protein [Verrucomicrobiae bacterium]
MKQEYSPQDTRDIRIGPPKAAHLNDIGPEFVDHQGLTRMFAIRRSHAYLLVAQGAIRSVCIRKPGAVKGRRLFDVQSVRDFLARQMKGGAQ